MMRYVALLRGINVGGKNRVPMKELKQYTEDLGYEEVVTYFNSGNAIFSSDSNAEDIRNKFEAMVLEKFHIDIPVMIVSYDDFISAHSQVPEWWNQNKEDVILGINMKLLESINLVCVSYLGAFKDKECQIEHVRNIF